MGDPPVHGVVFIRFIFALPSPLTAIIHKRHVSLNSARTGEWNAARLIGFKRDPPHRRAIEVFHLRLLTKDFAFCSSNRYCNFHDTVLQRSNPIALVIHNHGRREEAFSNYKRGWRGVFAGNSGLYGINKENGNCMGSYSYWRLMCSHCRAIGVIADAQLFPFALLMSRRGRVVTLPDDSRINRFPL